MADLQIVYLLYFPKLVYCLFGCHGALSLEMTECDRSHEETDDTDCADRGPLQGSVKTPCA